MSVTANGNHATQHGGIYRVQQKGRRAFLSARQWVSANNQTLVGVVGVGMSLRGPQARGNPSHENDERRIPTSLRFSE